MIDFDINSCEPEMLALVHSMVDIFLQHPTVDSFQALLHNIIQRGIGVDFQFKHSKHTLLHWAVIYSADAEIRQLLNLGAQVNIRDAEGMTCYDIAVETGNQIALQMFNRRDLYKKHLATAGDRHMSADDGRIVDDGLGVCVGCGWGRNFGGIVFEDYIGE